MLAASAQIEDRYLVVDGLRVRYWELGSGPPLLLIHGLGASVWFWHPNIAPLAERHRVLALDVPGFGLSDKTLPTYSLDYVVRFLSLFLEAVGVRRVSLAGNSMGGLLALRFALGRPDTVDRLILVSSGGLGREVALGLRLFSVPLLGEILARRTDREETRRLVQGVFWDRSALSEELVDASHQMACLPGAMSAALRIARVGIDVFGQKKRILLLDRLVELKIPTLIVWGQQDSVIPVSHAHEAHKRIKGSQLRIIDGCGHCAQIERPDEFNAAALAFLTPQTSEASTHSPA